MAARGYTTTEQVQAALGVPLTGEQVTQLQSLLEPAERAVDAHCRRAWLTGAITSETYFTFGRDLYLKNVPVTSVSSVAGRQGLGATELTLTADTDYEVRDLDAGWIWLWSPDSYDRIRVSYTPVATVPADVAVATAELVCHWLRPTLLPGSLGASQVQLPDLTIRFEPDDMPVAIRAKLAPYRFPVVG